MKKYIHFYTLIVIFTLSGCGAVDDLVDKAKEEYADIKNKYDEYKDAKERGERPFTIVYQADKSKKTRLISSQCIHNEALRHVYYRTPRDAYAKYVYDVNDFISYPNESKLKPFWDIRYLNTVSKYMNGGNYPNYADHSQYTGLDVRSGNQNVGIGTTYSQNNATGNIAQLECINGTLAGGATINLYDSPAQSIGYGGPHSSFKYALKSNTVTSPWKSNKMGNLMIQSNFNTPRYINNSNNTGGGISFVLFLQNKKSGKRLNYVIGIFAAGDAWIKEKAGIKFDTTTNIIHVATVIKDNSWWSTISPSSQSIKEIFKTSEDTINTTQSWNNFYRVNISYQNLLAVLKELKKESPAEIAGQNFGLSPEDWEITSLMLQYELEESEGEAILSGSFKGFEVYISENPL